MSFGTPLEEFSTLTKRQLTRYYRAGINTLRDVLFTLPIRYENYQFISLISTLEHDKPAQICARVSSAKIINGKRQFFRVTILDANGDSCSLIFFNFTPDKISAFRVGREGIFYGKARFSAYGFSLVHPRTIWLDEDNPPANIQPIYSAKLNYKTWAKLVDEALENCTDEEPLNNFPSLKQALCDLHRPQQMDRIEPARQRLAFEELLAQQFALQLARNQRAKLQAYALITPLDVLAPIIESLPFTLTEAQKKVVVEIVTDMQKPHPMNRLLQGDVGSGKTLIAFLACIFAALNKKQAVLLAPTEILAEQHFANFQRFFYAWDLSAVLLTRREKKYLTDIANGEAQIIIGTHAVFQEKVIYHNLALVIVDEQHRFGVGQRIKLLEKAKIAPHQLSMTATPIPRTLAMAKYGEISFSLLNERPQGRQEIITTIFNVEKRPHLIARVGEKCREGAQAYWVCPAIEETENVEAVEQIATQLQAALPDVKIAILHGKLDSNERQKLMREFIAGKTQLLVATTVIEVGVDVPNASLMIIENAERFGLAQLHQLRGRVGRGSLQSHCVLLYQENLHDIARERLQIIKTTTDGFLIAEEDLRLRGAGEILGELQAGGEVFTFVDWSRDLPLLKQAQEGINLEDERQWKIFQRWQASENVLLQT